MSEIHEFGGFRGGNTGFHSILVENCIKSSQYGGNRRINQRFLKAMNYETFCKKYVGLDVGNRKLSQLFLNTMLEKVPENNRSTVFTGFSMIFESAKSTKELLLKDAESYNSLKKLLK